MEAESRQRRSGPDRSVAASTERDHRTSERRWQNGARRRHDAVADVVPVAVRGGRAAAAGRPVAEEHIECRSVLGRCYERPAFNAVDREPEVASVAGCQPVRVEPGGGDGQEIVFTDLNLIGADADPDSTVGRAAPDHEPGVVGGAVDAGPPLNCKLLAWIDNGGELANVEVID